MGSILAERGALTYVLEGYPKPVLKILGIKDNFGYFFGDKRIGIR